MKTIQEQLRQWANRTADAYHQLATDPNHPECDLAFYTQSDLTKIDSPPELLILAINPGLGGSYSDQINNPNWHLPGRMTGERLLQGNPFFDQHKSWHLWKVLQNIFSRGNIACLLDDERKYVWTNLTFFNTPEANKIPSNAQDLISQTRMLINVLKPRRILCLGVNVTNYLTLHNTAKTLIPPKELVSGIYDGIPIFGIPHTSKRYSNEEMNMIGSCLGYLFNAESMDLVTPELIRAKFGDKIEAWRNRQYKFDFEELCGEIGKRLGEPFKKDPKTSRYDFTKGTALTVTKAGSGYVGIRAKRGAGKDWNSNLENRDKYARILLDDYRWEAQSQWIGIKQFKHIESIGKFIEELSAINKLFDQVS